MWLDMIRTVEGNAVGKRTRVGCVCRKRALSELIVPFNSKVVVSLRNPRSGFPTPLKWEYAGNRGVGDNKASDALSTE